MSVTAVHVPEMHCGSCVGKLERALRALPQVSRIDANLVRRQLLVTHSALLDPEALMHTVEGAGFSATLDALPASGDPALLRRLGIAGLMAMQVMMVSLALYFGAAQDMSAELVKALRWVALLFCLPIVAYAAIPFYRGALTRGINMDTPIALAVSIAFAASAHATLTGTGEVYYDSVAMFVFLLLLARYGDSRLKQRLTKSDVALPWHTRDLEAGAIVTVGEGELVPADGELLSETASVDEAALTGEAEGVAKVAGNAVFAGTWNVAQPFELRVTATGEATQLARIAARADAVAKPVTVQWADRVARVFVPAVLLIALTTYLVWLQVAPDRALPAALAVLVISCPCALSLAVPAALSAAQVQLRTLGIAITGGRVLEQLAAITHVRFDKTGTLTEPEPRVASVHVLGAHDAPTCLALAEALEEGSAHPLARAFAARADHKRAQPGVTQRQTASEGVSGVVDGRNVRVGSAVFCAIPRSQQYADATVYLSVDGRAAAAFEVRQTLRPDAVAAVEDLKALGLDLALSSGDQVHRCETVAAALGIACSARQSAEDKLQEALRIQKKQGRSLFVGDGLNDLPALAASDVSLAMLHASDLVRAKADAYLFTRRLTAVPAMVRIARATRRVMRQNLLWAAAYNVLAIPAAALGWVPPWLAAAGMVTSSLGVLLNAGRLCQPKPVERQRMTSGPQRREVLVHG